AWLQASVTCASVPVLADHVSVTPMSLSIAMQALRTEVSTWPASLTMSDADVTKALVSASIDRLATDCEPPLNSSQPLAASEIVFTALHPPEPTAVATSAAASAKPETYLKPLLLVMMKLSFIGGASPSRRGPPPKPGPTGQPAERCILRG